MTIKNALILGAGLGTRMGDVGKHLPKPLWPIFDHSMLYLQVKFLRSLGIQNIYVNVFHQSEKIIKEVNSWRDERVEIVTESELMGSGGAIHNLIEKSSLKNAKLLTINSDVFYMFTRNDLDQMESSLEDNSVVLLGREVNDPNYNELIICNGRLNDINKGEKPFFFLTYSGVGLLNLSSLTRVSGVSGFWDSVANYKTKNVAVLRTSNEVEFYDFGTLDVYFKNMKELYEMKKMGQTNSFVDFLEQQKTFELFISDASILGLKTLTNLHWSNETVELI